jgi:mannose-1-phosphate guanylyltransferase/mannose-6-phosphate isomerase
VRGSEQDHRWVIILAGGSGTRLSSLTTNGSGVVVPKQYCSLNAGGSLLGDALARAARLVGRERTVVVVAREHEAFWRQELSAVSGVRTVVQPANRGTAAGVLLPLLAVLEHDPEAQVTLLPSDHFVGDEASLAADLLAAQDAALAERRTLLLGLEPEAPEPDYGWILPGRCHGATRGVVAFVEKPGAEAASALMARGAVWNGFFVVAQGQALLELYAQRLPQLLEAFTAAAPHALPWQLNELYDRLPTSDFSRDVLAGAEPQLGLRIAAPCGWTDLGTPARVRACLARHRRPGARVLDTLELAALGQQESDAAGGPRGGAVSRLS